MIAFAFIAIAFSQLTGLPDVYQGSWTMDRAVCGREDTNGVTIEPQAITFYEAQGTVVSASQENRGAYAQIAFNGEGRLWNEAIRLRILPNDRLELTALGRTQTFLRCPRMGKT